MIEVQVHGIGIDARRAQPLVLLQEIGERGRILPVWVADVDAAAVVAAREDAPRPRPDSHTLIGNVLAAFGHRLSRVVITALRDNVFHAELVIDDGMRVDSRASDALALALRAGVGIEVDEAVFERAGVSPSDVHESEDEANQVSESEVERFRQMLDDASPSDFED